MVLGLLFSLLLAYLAKLLVELRMHKEELETRVAERTLSEQRFRDVAEVSGDWIWETDAEGRYTYVSDGVKAMLGYAAARSHRQDAVRFHGARRSAGGGRRVCRNRGGPGAVQ
jgi:PAS domain-containing protein